MARRTGGGISQRQLRGLVNLLPARLRPWALLAVVAFGVVAALFSRCQPQPPAPGQRPDTGGRWQQLTGCRLLENPYNDGDSVHVAWQGRDYIFRLYFVDTPETDTGLKERIGEQAKYWGVTPVETVALGKRAIGFTRERLGAGGRDFTVQTRWRDALGRSKQGRFYALITDPQGRDLGEALVGEGLARIFGMKTDLPDGSDASAYTAGLTAAERTAKQRRRGAWALAGRRAAQLDAAGSFAPFTSHFAEARASW